MKARLHIVLTIEGLELASEQIVQDESGVTLFSPVIFKPRGSSDYAVMRGVITRTIPWTQIKYTDATTGEA